MPHAALPIERIAAVAPAHDNFPSRLGAFFLLVLEALHASRRRQAQQLIRRYRHLLSDADAASSETN